MPIPISKMQRPKWENKRVRLRVGYKNPPGKVQVTEPDASLEKTDHWQEGDAQVYATLAVHQGETALSHKRKWIVSHVLCGLLITCVDRQEGAKKIAEDLWRICSAQLSKGDPTGCRESIPEWVKEWLRYCRRIGAYRDPEDFRE